MFILQSAVRNACRNKFKSITGVLICAAITLLLSLYMANLENNCQMLQKLPEAIPVTGTVSNLCGMQETGLQIKEERMDGILNSEYVKNPCTGVRLMAGIGEFEPEDWANHLNMYSSGTNNLLAVKGLTEENVEFMEGIGPDFLKTNEKQCLMQRKIMDFYNLKVGDSVLLTVYYYWYWDYGRLRKDPLSVQEYQIVGMLDSYGDINEAVPSDILFPMETIRDSYRRADIDFYADFCNFTVKDPLQLDALKEEMSGLGFLPVSATANFSVDGNALTIKDDTFIRSAQRARESIQMMKCFLPILFLAVLFAGFLTAYLFTRNRRVEYALTRLAGTGKKKSFGIFFAEYAALALMGNMAGILTAVAAGMTNLRTCAAAMGTFLGCYLMGTVAALAETQRLNVMEVLTKND
ncbi:MAG: hypothetical protein Q4F83_13960 [Eubacteriales bacterium]|nr:hypothetical protein [Eubacteriales bacterium]